MLVYIDRGALSSNAVNGSARTEEDPQGTGIQGKFNLSLFSDGLLSSAFMVGLLIACPIFAELSKHRNGFRLIAMGQLVWCMAVAASGASFHYSFLLLARMFVGVGEASFITLAAPFIDDNAPPRMKSLWLALFYMTCPAGHAAGYILGGVIGSSWGWRSVFFIEASVMIPFVVFGFVAQPIDLKRNSSTIEKPSSWKSTILAFLTDLCTIFKHPVYMMSVIGNTLLYGVIGVLAYWGPRAGKAVFQISGTTADTVFGLATVLTGIGGTVLGGLALDWTGSTLYNGMMVCGVGIFFGFVASVVAFTSIQSIQGFVPIFGLSEIGIFAANAPATAVQLWSVPPEVRPLGAAMATVSYHIFGDVPSPPIIGAVQEFLADRMDERKAWRIAMALATSVLSFSAVFMFLGAVFARKARDYRGRQNCSEEQSELTELENTEDKPLFRVDTDSSKEFM